MPPPTKAKPAPRKRVKLLGRRWKLYALVALSGPLLVFMGVLGSSYVTFSRMIDTICTGDVLVHTWDLARATGQDEVLDPAEVRRMFDGIEDHDEAMRESGHYGPKVTVPDGADDQTRLLAFLGRRP